MPTLLDTDLLLAEYDPQRDLILIRRRASRAASPDAMATQLAQLFEKVRPYADKPALMDLRQGPGNNDATYEQAVMPQILRLRDHFSVIALLLRTASGRLQMQRLGRERGLSGLHVYFDESEALDFLAQQRR